MYALHLVIVGSQSTLILYQNAIREDQLDFRVIFTHTQLHKIVMISFTTITFEKRRTCEWSRERDRKRNMKEISNKLH